MLACITVGCMSATMEACTLGWEENSAFSLCMAGKDCGEPAAPDTACTASPPYGAGRSVWHGP